MTPSACDRLPPEPADPLRALMAGLESAHEDGRRRLARQIHDELGSLMVALKMDLAWLDLRVADRPELRAKCGAMGRLVDSAVGQLGRIATDLRPSLLDHQGLWAALEWQAHEFFESAGWKPDVQVHVAAGVPLPGGVHGERWAIAVFRIFQLMLQQLAPGAPGGSARIRLYVDGPPSPMLYLDVHGSRDGSDDSEAPAVGPAAGVAEFAMRERAAHFGGSVVIGHVPGAGHGMRLTMPLPPADEGPAATGDFA